MKHEPGKIVKTISLRDLYRRAGRIAKEVQAGVEFEVQKRDVPVFSISAPDHQTRIDATQTAYEKTKHLIEPKKGKQENISQNIDTILYG